MALITSLILLSVLVLLPMLLAAKELVAVLFAKDEQPTVTKAVYTQADNNTVYDGMITVEIPISEPQVIAYEPPVPVGEEYGIEIVEVSGRASNA